MADRHVGMRVGHHKGQTELVAAIEILPHDVQIANDFPVDHNLPLRWKVFQYLNRPKLTENVHFLVNVSIVLEQPRKHVVERHHVKWGVKSALVY